MFVVALSKLLVNRETLLEDRRLIQADIMSGFLFAITELDNLQLQFNPPLWHTAVDHITVHADECLEFHFMNGIDVEVRL